MKNFNAVDAKKLEQCERVGMRVNRPRSRSRNLAVTVSINTGARIIETGDNAQEFLLEVDRLFTSLEGGETLDDCALVVAHQFLSRLVTPPDYTNQSQLFP